MLIKFVFEHNPIFTVQCHDTHDLFSKIAFRIIQSSGSRFRIYIPDCPNCCTEMSPMPFSAFIFLQECPSPWVNAPAISQDPFYPRLISSLWPWRTRTSPLAPTPFYRHSLILDENSSVLHSCIFSESMHEVFWTFSLLFPGISVYWLLVVLSTSPPDTQSSASRILL